MNGHMSVGFTLSDHAIDVMRERHIDHAWIEAVLTRPARTEEDPRDETLRHALGLIADRDGRVPRVIYNAYRDPWHVVTMFFDRRMRNIL